MRATILFCALVATAALQAGQITSRRHGRCLSAKRQGLAMEAIGATCTGEKNMQFSYDPSTKQLKNTKKCNENRKGHNLAFAESVNDQQSDLDDATAQNGALWRSQQNVYKGAFADYQGPFVNRGNKDRKGDCKQWCVDTADCVAWTYNTKAKYCYLMGDAHTTPAVQKRAADMAPYQSGDITSGVCTMSTSCLQAVPANRLNNGNGGTVDVWPCDTEDPAQRFHVLNKDGYKMFKGAFGNTRNNKDLCIDYNGHKVHMWECNEHNHNQHFSFDMDSHVAVDLEDTGLIKLLKGQCLSGKLNDEKKVTLAPCSLNKDHHQWTYDSTNNMIKNSANNKCLRTQEKKRNGALITLASCDTEDYAQKFYANAWNNQIKIGGSNLCLDADNHQGRGDVHAWSCDLNNRNQQWKIDAVRGIVQDDEDTGLFENVRGVCLDAPGSKVGGSIGMRKCNDNRISSKFSYDAETKQIKQLNTDRCLKSPQAHGLRNGGELIMWRCDTDDIAQRFYYNQFTGLVTAAGSAGRCGGRNCCIDANNNRMAQNDRKIHLWSCDEFNWNQVFHLDSAGHIGVDFIDTGLLRNTDLNKDSNDGLCVAAQEPNKEGGKVVLAKCNTDHTKQRWTYNTDTNQVQNGKGICMTYEGRFNGGDIQMGACDPKAQNQKFWYNPAFSQLRVGKNFCVDTNNHRDADRHVGKEIHVWTCNPNNSNQQFVFDAADFKPEAQCPTQCEWEPAKKICGHKIDNHAMNTNYKQTSGKWPYEDDLVISRIVMKNAHQCRDECQNTDECHAWVYREENPNHVHYRKCYMFKKELHNFPVVRNDDMKAGYCTQTTASMAIVHKATHINALNDYAALFPSAPKLTGHKCYRTGESGCKCECEYEGGFAQ